MATTCINTLQIRQEFIKLMTDMYGHDVGNELSQNTQETVVLLFVCFFVVDVVFFVFFFFCVFFFVFVFFFFCFLFFWVFLNFLAQH